MYFPFGKTRWECKHPILSSGFSHFCFHQRLPDLVKLLVVVYVISNSGQFSYPFPNMVLPLDTITATGLTNIFLLS